MDMSSNTTVHVETVDRREVQLKSPHMEWEGLSRALKYLEAKLSIAEMTTDSSTSVTSFMGKSFLCANAILTMDGTVSCVVALRTY